jgi:hypothetical protein
MTVIYLLKILAKDRSLLRKSSRNISAIQAKLDNSRICINMYGFYFKHNHKNTISGQIYNTTA